MSSFPPDTAVIIVDHGSKREQANAMLECVTGLYATTSGVAIVEHAHMELAEPDIPAAFAKCVARGAKHVVIALFFLSPGRHGTGDIPRIAEETAAAHPGVSYAVTAPLGVDERLTALLHQRVLETLG